MDYQFTVDTLNRPRAHFAMEQEAFGDWFSDELKRDRSTIEKLLLRIAELEQHQRFDYEWTGAEYQLSLSRSEATLLCLSCSDDDFAADFAAELTDDGELFEGDRNCGCGLDDFKRALLAWQEFIGNS